MVAVCVHMTGVMDVPRWCNGYGGDHAVGVVVTMRLVVLGVHRSSCQCLPGCRQVGWLHGREGRCSGCGGDHAVVVLDVYRYSCECLSGCRQVGWLHGREGRCSGYGGDHAVVVFGCAQVQLSVFARVQEGVMDGP